MKTFSPQMLEREKREQEARAKDLQVNIFLITIKINQYIFVNLCYLK